MTPDLRTFLDCYRVLSLFDLRDLITAGVMTPGDLRAWVAYRSNPVSFLQRADDATSARLWALVEQQRIGAPANTRAS